MAGPANPSPAGRVLASGHRPHGLPKLASCRGGRQYSVAVLLEASGELFAAPGCSPQTRLRELKEQLETVAGVPAELQRLSYLDEGDMPNESTFTFNGIVPGGTITLRVWSQDGWRDLVQAAADGDLMKLQRLGVTNDSSYNTPNSELLGPKQKLDWIARRAFVALYVSAHRGHLEAVKYLLQNGADVCAKTKLGTSALHVAASMGQSDCLEELLAHGAQIGDVDGKGRTALDLAHLWGHKTSERRLFLFKWRQRAAGVKVKMHLDESELFAHQKFDSKLKTWRSGTHAKRYMANLLKKGEFQGSSFSASKNN
ncbi:ankyrin repeat domain-containing protein 60 [Ambystoma mexicanum]|uniref:ankyrin repeat domain-containing protein 60 n=1 Tax=Ambystoma mexicanum TaxID=8296 RepID=UPI0037E73A30